MGCRLRWASDNRKLLVTNLVWALIEIDKSLFFQLSAAYMHIAYMYVSHLSAQPLCSILSNHQQIWWHNFRHRKMQGRPKSEWIMSNEWIIALLNQRLQRPPTIFALKDNVLYRKLKLTEGGPEQTISSQCIAMVELRILQNITLRWFLLRYVPCTLYSLCGKSFCQKTLSGNGGPPPLTESPLSFSGRKSKMMMMFSYKG